MEGKVRAVDNETGVEGPVSYEFRYNGEYVTETPDFRINPYTGVITTKRTFDRETKEVYTVSIISDEVH